MKTNRLVLLFLFLLQGVAAAQQTNFSFSAANSWTFEELNAKAEKGDPEAQYELGVDYVTGHYVSKDPTKAIEWFRKSAEQGNAAGQSALGVAFARGDGVSENNLEAVKWYKKAAEQGNAKAEYNLGVAYFRGEGIPVDYVIAYKWLNLAASQGLEYASEYRLVVETSMTPEQIAEAQQLTREFVPRKEATGSNSDSSVATDSPIASGTGFFITDDGFLVTCAHVVANAKSVRVVTFSGTFLAKVVQVDAANDIALLKADIPAPPAGYVLDHGFFTLPVTASRTVSLGDTVATVGFPDPGLQGFAPKLAKGEIASLSGAADDARYFQISVPVQPGNSGGALVDEHGNVIGIVSAKLDASAALAASGALPENVNYAVKSSFLLSFLESVPAVGAKLKAPNTADEKFTDVVQSAQAAAVLVLVY